MQGENTEIVWRVTIILRVAVPPVVALVRDSEMAPLSGLISDPDDYVDRYVKAQTETGEEVHVHVRPSDVVCWLAVVHSRLLRGAIGIVKPH